MPLETGGKRVVVFLGVDEPGAQILLQKLYPHATLEYFGPPGLPPSLANSVLRIVSIPARDIEELRGWTTTLEAPGLSESPRSTPQASWNWAALGVRPPFTAHVRGRLKVERYGTYRFVLSSAAMATLTADGGRVLSGAGRREARLQLAAGIHDFALDVSVSAAAGPTQLSWAGPSSDKEEPIPLSAMFSPRLPLGGLLGGYYEGGAWEGPPVFQRIDPRVAFYFHVLPLGRPFSIRWTGTIEAPEEGTYVFSTKSIDESFVSIDGKEIVRNPGNLQETEGTLTLTPGRHAIEVRYRNTGNYAQVFLSWIRPGHERELVPAEVLRPPPPAFRPEGVDREVRLRPHSFPWA